MELFSVYDSKGKFYSPPFMARNQFEATRTFQTLAKDKQTQVGQYPADYDLFKIASFDDQTGRIEPLAALQQIAKALDLIEQ